jgi:hypothetical protein
MLEGRVKALEAGSHAPARSGPTQPAKATGEAAPDADLDGKWGNPTIRKDPPRWSGPSFMGRTFAEAPPHYLESLAGFLDWRASKTEQEGDPARAKYVGYDRKDARLCRGWARRLRANPRSSPLPDPEWVTGDSAGADDDIGF